MDLNESIPYQLRNTGVFNIFLKYKLRHVVNLNNIIRYQKIGRWIPTGDELDDVHLSAKVKTLIIEAWYVRYPLHQICIKLADGYDQVMNADIEVGINNWAIIQLSFEGLPCHWLLDLQNIKMPEYSSVIIYAPSICETT